MEEETVTSGYFRFINDRLLVIEMYVPWADQVHDQLQLLKMDVRFLAAFCDCIKKWDYATDEESRERLRSMITTLTEIWLKEHKGLSFVKRLDETCPVGPMDMTIQDFYSAKFELEARIQQSKQQVEGWCVNLMHSSMQRLSLNCSHIRDSLKHLQKNLNLLSTYRDGKIVPLKKQIDILKAKIIFLEESLNIVESCPDGKEIVQFLNFICDFAHSAACLTYLYWAKEANEEIATEMNIVFFHMLQKFIPYAYDITPLYIGILKYCDLQPSDSFLFGEAVESFVDFFFEHLATILKDDFLVLRDRLIFLFTLLTDATCENVEVEDQIRSQIVALLSEDAYLLSPLDEIKEDLSDKKLLLSDCMMKIDIANTKIRQLFSGLSDTRISLEVEEMEYMYFVSVHRELSWIEKHAQWADPLLGQMQLYRRELRFLRVFLLCIATWDDSDEEIKVKLSSIITSLEGIWRKEEENGLLAHRLHAIRATGCITDWHPLASELEGKIQLSKLEVKSWWVNLFHWPFRCKPSSSDKIIKFLDSILKVKTFRLRSKRKSWKRS